MLCLQNRALAQGQSRIAQGVGQHAPFGLGHPASFALAEKVAQLTPEDMNHVFFVNSGSEAVDTALKIVMAYHSARGDNRHRFVSRERAYHGVNMGGVSLSGMVNNRRTFPVTMPNVVMMRHTWTGEELNVKGQPTSGREMAEDLERFAATYGAIRLPPVLWSLLRALPEPWCHP